MKNICFLVNIWLIIPLKSMAIFDISCLAGFSSTSHGKEPSTLLKGYSQKLIVKENFLKDR